MAIIINWIKNIWNLTRILIWFTFIFRKKMKCKNYTLKFLSKFHNFPKILKKRFQRAKWRSFSFNEEISCAKIFLQMFCLTLQRTAYLRIFYCENFRVNSLAKNCTMYMKIILKLYKGKSVIAFFIFDFIFFFFPCFQLGLELHNKW